MIRVVISTHNEHACMYTILLGTANCDFLAPPLTPKGVCMYGYLHVHCTYNHMGIQSYGYIYESLTHENFHVYGIHITMCEGMVSTYLCTVTMSQSLAVTFRITVTAATTLTDGSYHRR